MDATPLNQVESCLRLAALRMVPVAGTFVGAQIQGVQSSRMAATDTRCYDCRSRSPCHSPNGTLVAPLAKGQAVQFFHEADPVNRTAPHACPAVLPACGPQIRQSHGWLDGTMHAPFSPQTYDASKMDTWPFVMPSPSILFGDRTNHRPSTPLGPRRLPLWRVREPSSRPPALSLVLVRWAGEHPVGTGAEGDGGWGKFGCPPCDEYMSAMISMGVYRHPVLGGTDARLCNFEIFAVLIRNSRDLADVVHIAPWLVTMLRGRKKASFWMLWPAEWEDSGGADYAGYVERNTLFSAMRACEAVGLRSGFPHPADLYELVTSKSWMASLSMKPEAHLPAAVHVSRGSVVSDPRRAAKQALAALEHIRRRSPFPANPGESPLLSAYNKDGLQRGVVKMGWSWEGRFVLSFTGEEQLASRLTEMLMQPGCKTSTCIVQEWVDFDFEMRLYFLPPEDCMPGMRVAPSKIECNSWGGFSEEGRPHTFRKLSEAMCLSWWEQDMEALRSATEQATEVAQHLLTWLLAMDSQPVPMIRLDFMLRRLGPGRARVVFGEYCELGACCLAWEDGPPTIWKAALDCALR